MDSFLRTIDDELNDDDDESYILVLQFFRNLISEKNFMAEWVWVSIPENEYSSEIDVLTYRRVKYIIIAKYEKWKK